LKSALSGPQAMSPATEAPALVLREAAPGEAYRGGVTSPLRLVEFPADDPARARRFWNGVLDVELEGRLEGEGEGWQTHGGGSALGLHPRGTGPGDRVSLPYFSVPDMEAALKRVRELGGEVIHPGERWSVCRDTEGSPFGLAIDLT
jgi:predicted enzyme related to lactoylglutathione lyase